MKNILTILIISLFLGSCSHYKMDVQQGNIVEASSIRQLKIGMTREQVKVILGTPLLQDIFHKNRWDYVYYFSKPGQKPKLKTLVIFFQNDMVANIKSSFAVRRKR